MAKSEWVQLSPGLEMRQAGDPGLYEVEMRRVTADNKTTTWRASLLGSWWRPHDGMNGEASLYFQKVER